MMQAILIDTPKQTIEIVDYSGDYKDIYTLLGCELFTSVYLEGVGQDTLYVDDEGLYVENQVFFNIKGCPQPLAGRGLILGTDAFIELMTWHEWQQLFSLAHIIVASRPNLPLSELETNLEKKLASEYGARKRHDRDLLHSSKNGLIFTYEFTSLEVSGTSLRRRIQHKQSLKYLLPDNVINYIQNHNLYKEKTSESKPK